MLRDRLGKELLFFDGGMGTLLQEKGLQPGELPEVWNLEHAEEVMEIHREYYKAGSDIVLANTFGANALKFHDDRYGLKEIITAAITNARKVADKIIAEEHREVYVAMDMGPTGKLLKPMGDLSFEDAYETYAEAARYGEEAGADLVHIETMSDTYEVKAAILAARENTSLPVFVTMIFDEKGKLLTGGDVPGVVAMLEGLRVDALGMNCGLGPKQMMPILEDLMNRKTRDKVDSDKTAYLGVSVQDLPSEVSQMYNMPSGAFVTETVPGEAAEAAGIKKGDIIEKLDGQKVTGNQDLIDKLQYYESGETVEVVVARADDGEYKDITVEVTLGIRPQE